jgi:iron(III) transport system ATP-binding protein
LIRDRVRHVLRLVRLDGLEERPATDLSGGQQQRVALARALVTEPQVLLMDEPFSNLDARLRQEMRAELKTLTVRLGITTLFVTHDQMEALTMGDTICVMERGNVLQRGAPEEIYCSPRSPFVANFVGDMNFLEGRIVKADLVETELGTLTCHLPPNAEKNANVILAIRPEDIAFSRHPTRENNTFPGHVVGRYFLGDSIDYKVRGGGVTLIARRSRSADALSEQVFIQLPAGSLNVFPAAKERTSLRDRIELDRQPGEGDHRA